MDSLLKLPPIVQYVIVAVSSTASLLATQSLIDNRTEKLVTGLGAIWIPLGYVALVAVTHISHARLTAARITAGLPTRPTP